MTKTIRRVVAMIGLAALIVSCGGTPPPPPPPTESVSQPLIESRAVTLTTTACGHASRTSGAGVIVRDGLVLTSAHVVIGAGSIRASASATGADLGPVVVRRLDVRNDLAVLAVDGAQAAPIIVAGADQGERVRASGGGPSGAFEAMITRRVEVRIEEVRSTERSSRFGYEIDQTVDLGDSGGGLFNDRGELVAVVFGRSLSRSNVSFAVRSTEVESLVSADEAGSWTCEPTRSRLVRIEP